MSPITSLEQHDIERMVKPDSPWTAIRRRVSGRYQIDPFGLDPQLSDLLRPIASFAIKVTVHGFCSPRESKMIEHRHPCVPLKETCATRALEGKAYGRY